VIARIEQLEYIAAVARLGSYRKAAETLHISPPKGECLTLVVQEMTGRLPGAR
jgi:hypothetical protein